MKFSIVKTSLFNGTKYYLLNQTRTIQIENNQIFGFILFGEITEK